MRDRGMEKESDNEEERRTARRRQIEGFFSQFFML